MNTTSFFQPRFTLQLHDRLFSLGKPVVMGILNATPDSFYTGSRVQGVDIALEKAESMIAEGADILDIGGYSSRPGADHISIAEEKKRVLPIIKEVKQKYPEIVVSVDTFRAEVALAAVGEGADVINDISGGQMDGHMFATVGKLQVPYVLMHMKGTPQNMKQLAKYDNLIKELMSYFHQKIEMLRQVGCKDIILDPGFGFAKTISHNYQLLEKFEVFRVFELPLLAGLSRKSMIYRKLGIEPNEALNGTTALNTIALQKGASILRVHDVAEARQIIDLLYH